MTMKNPECKICGARLDIEIDDYGNVMFAYCPNWTAGPEHPSVEGAE